MPCRWKKKKRGDTMPKYGVDVSYHQGIINWHTVRKNGISKDKPCDFAIIRLGYGQGNLDKQAYSNLDGCEAEGIARGIYWFSYAYTEEMAVSEADHVKKLLQGRKLELPVYFDWEYASRDYAAKKGRSIPNDLLQRMTRGFCKRLEASKYFVGVYTNKDYYPKFGGTELFTDFSMWYASWTKECPRKTPLWQNDAHAHIRGIPNECDTDVLFTDLISTITKKGFNGYGKK